MGYSYYHYELMYALSVNQDKTPNRIPDRHHFVEILDPKFLLVVVETGSSWREQLRVTCEKGEESSCSKETFLD